MRVTAKDQKTIVNVTHRYFDKATGTELKIEILV